MKRKLLIGIVAGIILLSGHVKARESRLNKPEAPARFFLEAEAGFLSVLYHTLQQGKSSDAFDYVNQGGQDVLFPFYRFTAGALLFKRHKISFLYQPLAITTQTVFDKSLVIDGKTFAADTPVSTTYNFPFYRASYSYRFLAEGALTMGAGLSLQLRNATIIFESGDGSLLTEARSLGPVPALNFNLNYQFDFGAYLAFDLTGFYASSAILNGASYEFEGSILDASARFGYRLRNGLDTFLNLRFLGGTAKGESRNDASSFTANYLATLSLTLGFTLR